MNKIQATKAQAKTVRSSMKDLTEFYGEPISTYTEQQAVEDGMLVPVDEDRFPGCRFTRGVYDAIMEKVAYLERRDAINGITHRQSYLQCVVPLMMDVVMVAKKHAGDHMYTGDELDGNVTGKRLWFAMNDCGGITVMFPEDY